MSPLVIAGGGGLTLLAAAALLLSPSAEKQAKATRERLSGLAAAGRTVMDTPAEPISNTDSLLAFLPPAMRAKLAAALEATGGRLNASALAITALISAAIVMLLGGFVLHISAPYTALAALGFGVLIPYQVLRSRQAAHTAKYLALFPDSIDLIVRAVRAGLPVMAALEGVTREIGEPVGPSFGRIMADIKIGIGFEEALRREARNVRIVDFDFFVASLVLQREIGGNLTETLQTLSQVLRRRAEMRAKAKALTSEARLSAIVIGSLPFFAGGALTVFSPDYISVLITDPRGAYLLGGGLCSLTLAGLIMRAMIAGALK